MTTKSEIKAAIGAESLPLANQKDVTTLRSYFRWAVANVRFWSASTIDFGSIAIDAQENGHETSDECSDESVVAAAHLEGLVPVVLSGLRANGILWPDYHCDVALHARYWELMDSDQIKEAEALVPQLTSDPRWRADIAERAAEVARRVR